MSTLFELVILMIGVNAIQRLLTLSNFLMIAVLPVMSVHLRLYFTVRQCFTDSNIEVLEDQLLIGVGFQLISLLVSPDNKGAEILLTK